METYKLLNDMNIMCQKISSDSIASLVKMCEHPDIDELVKWILKKPSNREERSIQNQICTFIYDCGYNVQFDQFHSVDLIYQLDSFIGNYFYDDAEAVFELYEYVNTGLFLYRIDKSPYYNVPHNVPIATSLDFIDYAKQNVVTFSKIEKHIKNKIQKIRNNEKPKLPCAYDFTKKHDIKCPSYECCKFGGDSGMM